MAACHAFLFEGRRFRARRAGREAERVGFYTWRFVEAEDAAEAERIARADVDAACGAALERSVKSSVAARYEGVREAPEVATFAPGLKGTGFVLFRERAVVSDLIYAFEAMARRLPGRKSGPLAA